MISVADFEELLRGACKYGSTERTIFVAPDEVEEFNSLLEQAEVPGPFTFEVVSKENIPSGMAFIFDPDSLYSEVLDARGPGHET